MFEKVSKVCWGPALVLLTLGVATAEDQRLPLADGAYLSEEHCDMAERNELDMIGFQVENNGRSVGIYESGCLVATIKSIRQNRYHVELDCQEFGDLYQHQFFLDAISRDRIRVDGEVLFLCKKGFLSDEISIENSSSPSDLIELWEEATEGCSGGSGDDSKTAEACETRDLLAGQLNSQGLCFGREGQSRSQYDWHNCTEDSLR